MLHLLFSPICQHLVKKSHHFFFSLGNSRTGTDGVEPYAPQVENGMKGVYYGYTNTNRCDRIVLCRCEKSKGKQRDCCHKKHHISLLYKNCLILFTNVRARKTGEENLQLMSCRDGCESNRKCTDVLSIIQTEFPKTKKKHMAILSTTLQLRQKLPFQGC